MKSLTVCLLLTHMNNFRHLPPMFMDGDTRVVIHTHPEADFNDAQLLCNFDLLVTDQYYQKSRLGLPWKDFLPPEMVTELRRPPKAAQAVRLHQVAQHLGLKRYRHIPTYFSSNRTKDSDTPWTFGSGFKGRVVIKHMNGARGIGQIMFDVDRIPVDTVLFAARSGKDALLKLQERHPTICIPAARQNATDETYGLLKEELFLQEVVEDVEAEYRMLLRPDGRHWIYRRSRAAQDGFEQASGVFDEFTQENEYWLLGEDTICPLGEYAPEIRSMFGELGMTYGAVDLYTTVDGRWGVFEHSNQFGTKGYRTDDMETYHKDFIISKLP